MERGDLDDWIFPVEFDIFLKIVDRTGWSISGVYCLTHGCRYMWFSNHILG